MAIPEISKSSTMICTPLTAHSVEMMASQMYQAKEQGADLVEVRLDCLKNFQFHHDIEILLRKRPLPVIIVHRRKWEGGEYEGDEHSRLEALHLAKELGADFVEFDLKAAFDLIQDDSSNSCSGSKIIASFYVEKNTPDKDSLSEIVAQLQSTRADFIKLVTNATDITEIERIFHLLSHSQVPLIAYSLGDRGLISQILCRKFGGFFVYGSIEGEHLPGLPTLKSLREAYKVEEMNADTKVYGLISKPVNHSKGPILHNPTFRLVGHNGIYVPMFVDDLEKFFGVYSSNDFAGFSVGFPYKEYVIRFCHEVNPLAQRIGAVNTIIRRPSDGKLIGYNTDCEAAVTAIEDALSERGRQKRKSASLTGKMFVVVGAGGAGRALAFGAKSRSAHVVIFDIDFERAKSLACAVSGEAHPYEDLINFWPRKGAILSNATPLGMHPNTDRIPVHKDTFADYDLVFDSVYTPRKTGLLEEAEGAGAIVVSGVEMFLRQAVGQFRLFTGGEAPEGFMREIVLTKF